MKNIIYFPVRDKWWSKAIAVAMYCAKCIKVNIKVKHMTKITQNMGAHENLILFESGLCLAKHLN